MTADSNRDRDCPECGGSGARLGFRGDDIECVDCDGVGTIPACCAGCDRIEALDDEGFCRECMRLTDEVGSDPLWNRRAA